MADEDIVQSDTISWGEVQSAGDSVATGHKIATDTIKFFEAAFISDGTWRYRTPYRALPLNNPGPQSNTNFSAARNLDIQPEQDN